MSKQQYFNFTTDVLVVGVPNAESPFVNLCGRTNFRERHKCEFPGISVEFMDFILREAKINYSIYELPAHMLLDNGEPLGNGSWTGYLSVLADGIVRYN
jgi:hypothetical protein